MEQNRRQYTEESQNIIRRQQAAIDQLETLSRQEDFLFHGDRQSRDVPSIANAGLRKGLDEGASLVVFDTAGRLHAALGQ